jgi:CubicO group peptidase (beta-lactamase class C family)
VVKYVPELALLTPPRDAPPVTLRHLLTHTAGFPEDNPVGDRQMVLSNAQLSELLRRGIPFSHSPGETFEYSNLGFAILGRVVSRVSGTPYQAYVQREIFRPLGMDDTYWDARSAPAERMAVGYRREGDRFIPAPLEDGGDSEFAAIGGIITSTRDLARWVALMISAYPARDDEERPPALRRTLREMQAGSRPTGFDVGRAASGVPLTAFTIAAGFGLFELSDCRLSHVVTHSGGLPGFGSNMRWVPDRGVGVITMANLTYSVGGRVGTEILGLLADTGALKPRVPVASAALVKAARDTARIIDTWDDKGLESVAAANLFLDDPLDKRRAAIKAAREGLGACRPEPIKAENALRGTYRMACDNGWIDVTLTLTPEQPPRVQHLSLATGKPMSAGMKKVADDALAAFAMGAQKLRLASGTDRAGVSSQLESIRQQYGACHLGETLDGDGTSRARVRLACDRGEVVITLRASGEDLVSVAFAKPPEAACVP